MVTLIVVNKILKDNPENSSDFNQNQTGVQLVDNTNENTVLVNSEFEENIEEKLEKILSKINGVRKC